MAWPPSAVLEGGARREALGGMESELVPTEPSQTYPIASVRRLSIIEKRPTNIVLVGPYVISFIRKVACFADGEEILFRVIRKKPCFADGPR